MTRSANNPPAPPWGEGVLDHASKTPREGLVRGPRHPPRHAASGLLFHYFLASKLLSRNPTQGLPKAHPRDPQITRISTFCFKSRPRDPMFIDFLDDLCCFSLFPSIFGPFFAEKNMKKNKQVFQSCACFFDLATLRIVCILQCESHFLYFASIRFLTEKCIKIQAKMVAKKSAQHDALEDSNSSQNVWTFNDLCTETCKFTPKM